MGSWSNLCNDILDLIMDQFSEIEDIFRFGAVCRTWQSVSVEQWQRQQQLLPWLMLAEKEDSDRRGFYSLSNQKVYHMNLPDARDRRCFSSNGWLITFGLDLEINLLNLFSRVQIRLPPQSKLPRQFKSKVPPEDLRQFFIQKVVLSSRPSLSIKPTPSPSPPPPPCGEDAEDEQCVVMVIYSDVSILAFSRLGDEVWTAIDCVVAFSDIIYFNGQFYALNYRGELFICDISSPQPKTIVFAEPRESVDFDGLREFYLVESLGDLFLVSRDIVPLWEEYVFYYDDDDDEEDDDDDADDDEELDDDISTTLKLECRDYKTVGFDVCKFNFDNRKWMEVKSLGNSSLFVGNNSSFAISPSKHQHQGCEPNCIYFTDSYQSNLNIDGGGNDMGVFRMETREIESHYVGPDFFSHFCTPLWICPSL